MAPKHNNMAIAVVTPMVILVKPKDYNYNNHNHNTVLHSFSTISYLYQRGNSKFIKKYIFKCVFTLLTSEGECVC